MAAAGVAGQVQLRELTTQVPALHWHDDRLPPPPEWLIKGMLPRRGHGLLSGQWGTGKTFVALELAGAIITGLPFAGRKVKRIGGVLVIAAEAAGDIPLRLEGLIRHRLEPGEADIFRGGRQPLPFAWVETCAPLTGGPDELIAVAKSAADKMREHFKVELALIVVDTIAAAAGFTKENDAGEAQLVMNTLGTLSKATDALVLGIDHFGKDAVRGTRGSSAKEASADVVLALLGERDESGKVPVTTLAVRKLRGGVNGLEIPFELRQVPVSHDEDGDEITTCVVEWDLEGRTRRPEKAPRRPRGTEVLQQVIETLGGLPQPRDEVRRAFFSIYNGKSDGATKTALTRATDDLRLHSAIENGVAILDYEPAPF